MLKLGCMSLSYKDEFGADKLDLEQFIERAYQLRLDGIDLHTRAFASLEPGGESKPRICQHVTDPRDARSSHWDSPPVAPSQPSAAPSPPSWRRRSARAVVTK